MKRLISLFTMSLFFASAALAQGPNMIVVITRADWCSVCVENGPRVGQDVVFPFMDKGMLLILHDITDERKKKQAEMMAESLGVAEVIAQHPGTGKILIFDPNTKELLETVYLNKPSDEIRAIFERAERSIHQSKGK